MRTPLKIALLAAAIAAAGIAAAVHWRGHVRCYLFYPECSPFVKVPEEKPWDIPVNPVEKAAYDYSHALPLPPGMPQPVPFDFRTARLQEGYGGKSVGQQYFEHLCATEDVEVIVQSAKDVRGFQILRPRGNIEATRDLNTDRYRLEEVTGHGWLGDGNQLDQDGYRIGVSYVQPMHGIYDYVEYENIEIPKTYYRVERTEDIDHAKRPYGIIAGWAPKHGLIFRVPYVISRVEKQFLSSDFLYTWRGIRRNRDREFGVGGGEYIVVDKSNDSVLSLKRTFNSTYVPNQKSYTNWYGARECPQKNGLISPISLFINRSLNPPLSTNDAFVPKDSQAEYKSYLLKKLESRYEH